MFGTIRRHQKLLWGFIIALMSISLIVFFSADARLGRNQQIGEGYFGMMNNKPVPEAVSLAARKEVMIAHFLRSGNWPGNDEQSTRAVENETLSRVLLI